MTTLRKQLSETLKQKGFKRLHNSIHLLPIDIDFSFWADTGLIGLAGDIAPYVGLRSAVVQATLSDLMQLDNDPWTATVGANAGYVLDGSYRSWQRGADIGDIQAVVFAALEKLRPYSSITTLANIFQLPRVSPDHYVYVVLALLVQDKPLLLERLKQAKTHFCIRPDEVCSQYLAFEERVRVRCDVA